MARYNLIMKDEIYIALIQIGAARGLSFGKLANQILSEYVASQTGKEVNILKYKHLADRTDRELKDIIADASKLGDVREEAKRLLDFRAKTSPPPNRTEPTN